tara:strand:- start:247 stop:1641 length:1395 start_codon:yes stop_codon:yes gene_type:complete
MKIMKINSGSEFYNKPSSEDDIDLIEFLKFILRNKKLIFSFTVSFFILGVLLAILKNKVWEGQFQIVLNLDKKTKNKSFQGIDSLAGLAGIDLNLEDSLNTEVGILKSPSVLKPVYDFVKNDMKTKKTNTNFKSFKEWRKDNLKISLEKGTSILDIKYRDVNKEIIIPVLTKMTNVYQDYSGKNKRRGIKLTKVYLIDQIKIFKNKSINSIRAAQEFAIDQDLTLLDLNQNKNTIPIFNKINGIENITSSTSSSKYTFGENIGIELARVKAANKIREIDIKIKKIMELGDQNDDIQYISLIVPNLVAEGLPEDLRKIDMQIVEMESKYTDNFEPLKNIKDKRKILVKLIKQRALGFLKASKFEAEVKMESAKRPKGVILRYKELIREASRDEATLIALEDSLTNVKLEESRIEDPWQLITNPTLEETHVSPSKKVYGFIGIIIGMISSSILCYLKENKSTYFNS